MTGDLSRKKLMPAVYDLANRGLLPPGFALVGFARRRLGGPGLRGRGARAVKQYARTPFDEDVWSQLAEGIRFVQGEFDDDAAFERLKRDPRRTRRDTRHAWATTRSTCRSRRRRSRWSAEQLSSSGLAQARAADTGAAWSSRSRSGTTCSRPGELNDIVESVFPPDSVFRIDHYLGKETVQNILALRFANQLFEPIWNANYVDHVQITMAEDIGVGGRAGYYDGIGAARDVIQNHLLQLLALTAMEEPISFDADDLRAEKEKVLAAVGCPRTCPRHRRAASTPAAGRAARRSPASSRRTA